MKIKTIIIGLGQIGQGYDYALNHKKYILTHAQAIQTHPAFELIGGFDISENSRKMFEEKFHKPSFAEINAAMTIEDLGLVVVAVPAEKHLDTIKNLSSKLSPKLILIEKPLSYLFEESQEIIQIGKEKNVPIAVNYIREYEPFHRKFFERIKNSELGYPLKTVCWYSKGLINNGSHFIQLLSNFMGEAINICIINERRQWNNIDPEPAIVLNYEKGHAYFLPVEEESYSLFEMEIIGPKGKIKYYQGGNYYDWWKVEDDPVFNGYKKLEIKPVSTKTDMSRYQYHVYDNIAKYFAGTSDLYCDGKSALMTAEILNQIQQKLN